MKKFLFLGVVTFFSTSLFAQNTNQNLLSPVGNVGIGTTSPTKKFQLIGEAEIDGNIILKEDVVLDKLKENAPSQVLERYLTIDKDGKVGRGEIIHPGGNPLDGIIRNAWTLNGNNNTTSSNFLGTKDNAALVFKTNSIERMRILGNETKVGIGTSNPEATLHVNGNAKINGLLILQQLEIIERLKIGTSSLYLGSITNVAGTENYIKTTSGPLKINGAVSGISGAIQNTVINPDGGFVGIGTSNPQKMLHVLTLHNVYVADPGPTDPPDEFEAPHGSHYGLRLEDNTMYSVYPGGPIAQTETTVWDIEPHDGKLKIGKPHQPFVVMTDDYKLGIKTSNPAATLHVNGDARIDGSLQLQQLDIMQRIKVGSNSLYLGNPSTTASADNQIWTDGTYVLKIQEGGNKTTFGGEVELKTTAETNRVLSVYTNGTRNFSINGKGELYARKMKATMLSIPDYVFDEDYKLMSLDELETYINTNHHLPGFLSAKEIEANNNEVDLVETVRLLQEKVEELTLYVIDLKLENDVLESRIKK